MKFHLPLQARPTIITLGLLMFKFSVLALALRIFAQTDFGIDREDLIRIRKFDAYTAVLFAIVMNLLTCALIYSGTSSFSREVKRSSLFFPLLLAFSGLSLSFDLIGLAALDPIIHAWKVEWMWARTPPILLIRNIGWLIMVSGFIWLLIEIILRWRRNGEGGET